MKKIQIELTPSQREALERFSKTGTHSARLITRANIILLLDVSENRPDVKLEEIASRLNVSIQTVQNARRDFLAVEDVAVFLERKKRLTPPVQSKITGEVEAKIIALACSTPPEGYARWTLRMLANKSVELCIIDSLSHNAVKVILKKRNLSLT